ncbi:MAG: hypothetical protein NTU54_00205, partial [Candidatus Omnitrophica bacterium]|nr:hypothetical protein [Candidatus Omnitrophota bacterium]
MSDLFLAEHDFQVKDFIRRGFRNSGDWITLGPSAMMALDNEKIPYRIPEDFFMPEDLESACLKSHERVEFLSERLDQLAVEKYTELRDYGIRPFLFSIFPLTIIFDALVSRIFILKAILEANNNCRIFIHSNTSSSFGFFEIAFTMEDTLWGQVLSLAGWDREIEVLPDPIKSKDNALFHSILDRFSVDAMQRILKSAYFCKVRKKKSILIKGDDMWHYVEHSLKDKGWRIIRGLGVIKNAELPGRERPSVVDSIKSNPELMDYFGYRGICFFSLIEKRLLMLESLAAGSPSRILARLHSLIEGSGLIGILISSSATFTDQAINQLAKYLGLPVINWQHGFIYYDQSISQLSEYKELMGSKVLFTYGQEVTRGFNHYLDKFPCKIYSVGSPAIEAIRKKPAALRRYTAKKKMHILYATSTYYQNYWYFGFSPPFSDRLFYQDQLIIIESLNKIALSYKHKITIKLHPLLHDQIFW